MLTVTEPWICLPLDSFSQDVRSAVRFLDRKQNSSTEDISCSLCPLPHLAQMVCRMSLVESPALSLTVPESVSAVAEAEMLKASQSFSKSRHCWPSWLVCLAFLMTAASSCSLLLEGIAPLSPVPVVRLSLAMAPPWQLSTAYSESLSLDRTHVTSPVTQTTHPSRVLNSFLASVGLLAPAQTLVFLQVSNPLMVASSADLQLRKAETDISIKVNRAQFSLTRYTLLLLNLLLLGDWLDVAALEG